MTLPYQTAVELGRQQLLARGGDRRSKDFSVASATLKRGTSDHWLARLARDAPDDPKAARASLKRTSAMRRWFFRKPTPSGTPASATRPRRSGARAWLTKRPTGRACTAGLTQRCGRRASKEAQAIRAVERELISEADAEHRLGEALKTEPKTKGGDAQRTRFQKGTQSPPTLAEKGVTKKRSTRAQKLAASTRPSRRAHTFRRYRFGIAGRGAADAGRNGARDAVP